MIRPAGGRRRDVDGEGEPPAVAGFDRRRGRGQADPLRRDLPAVSAREARHVEPRRRMRVDRNVVHPYVDRRGLALGGPQAHRLRRPRRATGTVGDAPDDGEQPVEDVERQVGEALHIDAELSELAVELGLRDPERRRREPAVHGGHPFRHRPRRRRAPGPELVELGRPGCVAVLVTLGSRAGHRMHHVRGSDRSTIFPHRTSGSGRVDGQVRSA